MYTNMRRIMNEYKRDEIAEIMERKGLDISGITGRMREFRMQN